MIDIIGSKDCGNSPKNKLIEKICIALEVGDFGFLEQVLSEESVWELSDGSVVEGNEISRFVKKVRKGMCSIDIDHVASHGKVGSVNGAVHFAKNQVCHFCHIIEFSSVKCEKVKKLNSYCKS